METARELTQDYLIGYWKKGLRGKPAFADSHWRLSNPGWHRVVGVIWSSRRMISEKEILIIVHILP